MDPLRRFLARKVHITSFSDRNCFPSSLKFGLILGEFRNDESSPLRYLVGTAESRGVAIQIEEMCLDRTHEDLRVLIQILHEGRRTRLRGADDQKVWKCHV